MGYSIKQKCDYLEALEKAQPARPADVGEVIGMTAFNAGQLAKELRLSKYIEWASKPKHLHRITEKGRKYKANPPAKIKAAGGTPTPPVTETVHETVTKTVPETVHETVLLQTPVLKENTEEGDKKVDVKESEAEKKNIAIPSQADIFRSIAQQLGITKAEEAKGGTALEGIINFVERTADMDDLDSIEKALIGMNVPAHIRKRWLTLYAQSLPTKDRHMSPELAKMLDLEGKEEREKEKEAEKPKTQMYNVINGQICADAEGEYTFSKAVQKVMAEKPVSSDQASSLITALMPLLDKGPPPPPPPPDMTFFQSLQTRMEQLADERNKAQLDALRAEMKSGQRPPETDIQIQTLTQGIETMREELHKQQLERLQDQHAAALTLLTNKFTQLEQQVRESTLSKQVDSKYGLMSEGLKGVLNEMSGARKDFKEAAPTFLSRGREKTVRTPEQKAGFDQGVEQAVELEKRARELEDELFFGKES